MIPPHTTLDRINPTNDSTDHLASLPHSKQSNNQSMNLPVDTLSQKLSKWLTRLLFCGMVLMTVHFFLKFLEQEIPQALHFSNHPAIQVDPAGY